MGQPGEKALGSVDNPGELEEQSNHLVNLRSQDRLHFRFGASMSPKASAFAPLLFAGRLDEGITALSSAGFAAVEISLRQMDELDIVWLDERLSELGLVVSAFATGRMCIEDSLCLSDTNLVTRELLFERLVDFIQLAAHFKASLIVGGVRGKLTGDDRQRSEQRKSAIDTLRQCAEIAGELGVNLLVEPINRYETNFINTAQDGIELIEAIGHPCVKLLLDTFHMNIEEIDPCITIRNVGTHLGYVHFADSNRQAPGWGHINFSVIVEALAGIGYQGFINAEILPIPDDAQALYQTGQFIHSLRLDKR